MRELFREAEEEQIDVAYTRLPLNESMSACVDGRSYVLMDYALIGAEKRERVHLAHELGHCVTGSFYNPHAPLDVRRKHENTADRWAVQKLIPVQALDQAVGNGLTELWQLAEFFDVTEELMVKAVCLYTFGNLAADEYFPG